MIEELYINGNYIELGEASKIGVTFQVNDIANLANRQGTFSNEFKVPKTKNNQIALEFCSVLNSLSQVPYQNNIAKYVQNGIEIVPNGFALIKSYDGFYKIQISSGNVNVFDLMADRYLNDLDYDDFQFEWTLANVVTVNANVTGLIFPIIDYNGASITLRQIDVRRLIPGIWAKSILERIFTAINYTYTGDFKTGPFDNLVIPLFTDNKVSETFAIDLSSSANITPDLSSTDFVFANIFDTIITDANNQWRFGNIFVGPTNNEGYYFVADISSNHTITASIPYTSIGTGIITVRLSYITYNGFYYYPTPVIKDYSFASGSSGTINISEIVFLNFGDLVAITVMSTVGIDIVTFSNLSTLGITRNQLDSHVVFGEVFPVAVNLPKIKQSDFIKMICQMYCLSFQTNYFTKNIEFNSFSKIKDNIPLALDWSDLFDITQPFEIEYTIGDYAQTNVFQYKQDKSVNNGVLLYSGNLYVNNENLPLSKIAVQLPFAETEMTTKLNGLDIPYINKYNVITDNFDLDTEPRLLYLDKQATLAGGALTYIDGINTPIVTDENIPLCYFVLPDRTNLGFADNLLENNYSELQSVLINVKKVTGFLKLNATHISNLDFSIPIFLNVHAPKMQINGYFYLNKIGNFQSGKLSQSELIRL